MNKENGITLVLEAVARALQRYDIGNIDVVGIEEENTIDIYYSGRHNSYPIESEVVKYEDVDIDALERELDARNVGYWWS